MNFSEVNTSFFSDASAIAADQSFVLRPGVCVRCADTGFVGLSRVPPPARSTRPSHAWSMAASRVLFGTLARHKQQGMRGVAAGWTRLGLTGAGCWMIPCVFASAPSSRSAGHFSRSEARETSGQLAAAQGAARGRRPPQLHQQRLPLRAALAGEAPPPPGGGECQTLMREFQFGRERHLRQNGN